VLGLWFVGGVLALFAMLTALFATSQFRRDVPLEFRCVRCGHRFQQRPHVPFPRACPACRSTDWPVI
jgi:hypothetical protein